MGEAGPSCSRLANSDPAPSLHSAPGRDDYPARLRPVEGNEGLRDDRPAGARRGARPRWAARWLEVLDVGCKDGAYALAAAEAGARVVGVDASPTAVEAARRRAAAAELGAAFQVGAASQLPFVAEHFDVMLAVTVLRVRSRGGGRGDGSGPAPRRPPRSGRSWALQPLGSVAADARVGRQRDLAPRVVLDVARPPGAGAWRWARGPIGLGSPS